MEGIRSSEAREQEARDTGGRQAIKTMEYNGEWRQAGGMWIRRHIAGVKEA